MSQAQPEKRTPVEAPAPGPQRGHFAQAAHWLAAGLNSIGTIWILALMVLINADIAGRTLLNIPIRGVPELVSMSIVGIVFLQMSHTLESGRIIKSDAMLDLMLRRIPRTAHALAAIFQFVGVALFAVILWASYPFFVKAWTNDLFIGAAGDFTAPIWPVKLIILLGCFSMSLQYVVQGVRHLKAAFSPASAT